MTENASDLPLLKSIFQEDDATLLDVVSLRLREGHDPDAGTTYGELPLTISFRRGRMDVVAVLLENGADVAPLGWSALHRAVALGGLSDVEALISDDCLSVRDKSDLTPFLLAVDVGDIDKAAALLPASKIEDTYRTRNREPALIVAADKGRIAMIEWLLANGFDVNETAEFGKTALMTAAGNNHPPIVKMLLSVGARTDATDNISAYLRSAYPSGSKASSDDTIETLAGVTSGAEVARLLIKAGVELDDFDRELMREFTRADLIPEQTLASATFEAQKHRWFGTANPEKVAPAFWLEAIRTGESAYSLSTKGSPDANEGLRDPIWCHDRFGMSTTALSDGRWVQIAGEHEDYYDANFCIYSDVFVFDGKGGVEIYIYPRDVFPPTDFHTATLAGNEIILIGSLGYNGERREGETQVMRLRLDDFSIASMATTGASPGWISRHKARLEGERIVVSGGMVMADDDYVVNEGVFALDLTSGVWVRL